MYLVRFWRCHSTKKVKKRCDFLSRTSKLYLQKFFFKKNFTVLSHFLSINRRNRSKPPWRTNSSNNLLNHQNFSILTRHLLQQDDHVQKNLMHQLDSIWQARFVHPDLPILGPVAQSNDHLSPFLVAEQDWKFGSGQFLAHTSFSVFPSLRSTEKRY